MAAKKEEEKKLPATTNEQQAGSVAGTALDVAKGTAMAMGGVSFEDDAGKGMEGVDKDSAAIPFLTVLQGLSPQMETIEGAKLGMIINTVTNQLFSELVVVPVAFQRRFLRWTPRNAGGGFKGQMLVSEVEALVAGGKALDVKDDKGRNNLTFEGDHLKDTRIHYVIFIDPKTGLWSPAVMSLSSSMIKVSKNWIAQMNSAKMEGKKGPFTPPSYAYKYTVSTEKKTNKDGSWFVFDVVMLEAVDDIALYNGAKAFHAQIMSGDIVIQPPAEDEGGERDVSGEAGGKF